MIVPIADTINAAYVSLHTVYAHEAHTTHHEPLKIRNLLLSNLIFHREVNSSIREQCKYNSHRTIESLNADCTTGTPRTANERALVKVMAPTQLPGDARIQYGCKVRLYGRLS